MEVRDYNQALSDARENYNKMAQDMRSNYDEQVDHIKKTAEHRINKQADNYANHKAQLEDAINERSNFLTNETKKELAARTKDFSDKLVSAKKDFHKQNEMDRENFRNRLGSIENSFDKAMNSEKKYNTEKLNSQKALADANLKKATDNFNNSLDQMNDEKDQRFAELNADNKAKAQAREQMYRENFAKMQSEHQKQFGKYKDDNQAHLAAVTNSYAREKAAQNKAHNDAIKRLTDNHQASVDRLTNQFNDSVDKMNKDFKDEHQKVMANAKESIQDNNQKAHNDVQAVRSIASQSDVAHELKHTNQDQELERVTGKYEARLKKLQDEMAENNKKSYATLKRANDNFETEIKNVKAQEQKDTQFDLANAAQQRALAASSSEQEIASVHERFATSFRDQEKAFQQQLKLRDNKTREVFKQNEDRYNDMIAKMNESRDSAVAKMNHDTSVEQRRLQKANARTLREETTNLRDNLTKTFDKRQAVLQEELNNEKLLHKKTIEAYELKLEEYKRKSGEEFERLAELANDRQIMHNRELKDVVASKDFDNKKAQAEVRAIYEKKLASVKKDHEVQMKQMIDSYEAQLKTLKKESSKELQMKMAQMKSEYEKLRRNTEMRLASL